MVFSQFYPVSVHKSHEHEYDYVESMGAQDAHPISMDESHMNNMSILRKQYYAQNTDTNKRKYYI